jgi:cytochrome c553
MTRLRIFAAAGLGALFLTAGPAQVQDAATLLNCTACHKLTPDEGPAFFPVLNGQPAGYITRQLEAYRTGARQHPQMQQTARLLGEDGAGPMALMYSEARAPLLRADRGARTGDESVEALVFYGDPERGIPSCASCHGALRDDPPGYAPGLARDAPILHGQPESYVAQTLRDYASGDRQTGPMQRMQQIAAALSDYEMDELASYYAAWEVIR